ncbi:mercuric transporter MerT family protein [Dongia deserti]|uniref:mercuric transporter MerT family protein n=1 Tax=Dongia deserti TaxID=2268030 RepID=UPI000E64D5E0|nr:mercuric transporter MerT family protein [Dongia deserti]
MMRRQIADNSKDSLLAAGGLVGGIGASSCCILPLALVLAGVSGAWIGGLAALAPYQPIFLGIGAFSVGSGFWRVYGRRRRSCEGPQCGTPVSRRWTKTGLWLGAGLILIAGTTSWWAPLLT